MIEKLSVLSAGDWLGISTLLVVCISFIYCALCVHYQPLPGAYYRYKEDGQIYKLVGRRSYYWDQRLVLRRASKKSHKVYVNAAEFNSKFKMI